jgi:NADPH-dependent 2,4-dienoyl-CoA reductase/sulfur reductase-like enzyme
MEHIILGDGAAGATAARAIRRADPAARIRILSDDPDPAYYRADGATSPLDAPAPAGEGIMSTATCPVEPTGSSFRTPHR